MEAHFWIIILAIFFFSLISAALLLLWFFKKVHPIQRETVPKSIPATMEPDTALQRWRFFAVSWPLLCAILAGVIFYQSLQKMEGRFAGDAAFTIIPLIFFAVGMAIRRRLLKERRYATALTIATVVSTGRSAFSGKVHYFPEYEFQAGEVLYHVKAPSGYSRCYVKEKSNVELYYAPENPKIFYVPVMQKHDSRWAMLLCGAGIVYPFLGLLAPWLRVLLSS